MISESNGVSRTSVEVAICAKSAKVGRIRRWVPTILGSDGRQEFQRMRIPIVGVNLAILGGLGVGEGDAQTTEGEKPQSKLTFIRIVDETRGVTPGFSSYPPSVGGLLVNVQRFDGCC